MAADFHTLTSAICAALEAEGLASDADGLRSALAVTGSLREILVRIRWHLRRVHRQRKVTNPATRRAIDTS